ncbi:metal-dependent hydrolase [Bacillus safensis]|uniref:metal-dependent hydrolase n=2 Tax=Bacillus safensis TaxID=561879 RepID=UPI002282CBD9|nr:metal-dependent hydrolase [Bacillus safensis]MCY7710260.1 metal-dependent hydrolase [Bacillus safensis]MED0882924.1 metal-dependent hydrolase [Bacillus safensis]MED0918210.1 metal-dependent hydrolase [Bacillus safensis]
MTGKTHIMGGIAASTAVAYYYGFDPVTMAAAGSAGALIPDLCHTKSKIGRKFPLLSTLISSVFGHRTFTHSLLFLLIIYFLATTYIPNDSLSIGLLGGMASHLILDAGTVNGIKFLFPASIKVRLPFYVKTGSTGEQVVLAALTVVTCYYIAVLCGISIPF